MFRRILLYVTITVLLAACASQPALTPTPDLAPSPTPDRLAYDPDPNVLVIDVRGRIHGGAPDLEQPCDGISHLRIWGDGRVLNIVYQENRRQISSGHIDSAHLRDILVFFSEQGFFAPWTPAPPNPAGTGYNIQINLKAQTYSYNGAAVGPLYTQFQSTIEATELKPFVPVEALLFVEPYGQDYPPANTLPEWPAQYGSSLTDVPASGQRIEGKVLMFVWQQINEHNVPYTGFHEEGNAYTVSLQIPDRLDLTFGTCE